MILSVQQVKYELLAYMKEFDPGFSNWYVGISNDPKRTLFDAHGVRDAEDPWLYKQLLTFRAARTVQAYFIEHLKTKGDPPSAETEDYDCVYLYKIEQHTSQ
jgi:hypothetical protein